MGEKYEISWTVNFEKEPSTNAQISVEGYDELPSQIPAGDDIVVTVEGINGYRVYNVKVNNRKILPNENGKYVFTVPEKTDVEITLKEKVESVNMPDLTFYAGDQIDRNTPSTLAERGRAQTVRIPTLSLRTNSEIRALPLAKRLMHLFLFADQVMLWTSGAVLD